MMITIRGFLLLISCSILLGGCNLGFKPSLLEYRPCPDPGSIGNKTCYYHLTIVNKGQDSMVTGQVSQRVLGEQKRWRQELDFFDFSDYQDENNYPFHKYRFSVASGGFNELVEGNDYWFQSTPGESELKKITVPSQHPERAR